jgi:hypothetical protein
MRVKLSEEIVRTNVNNKTRICFLTSFCLFFLLGVTAKIDAKLVQAQVLINSKTKQKVFLYSDVHLKADEINVAQAERLYNTLKTYNSKQGNKPLMVLIETPNYDRIFGNYREAFKKERNFQKKIFEGETIFCKQCDEFLKERYMAAIVDDEKAVKKLHPNQKCDLDKAIKDIVDNPLLGEEKQGSLMGIRVHKFKMIKQPTLLAYIFQNRTITLTLLAFGTYKSIIRDIHYQLN